MTGPVSWYCSGGQEHEAGRVYDWAPAAMVFGVQAGVAILESPAVGEEEVGVVGVIDSILRSRGVIGREQLLQTRAYHHCGMIETFDTIAGDQDLILDCLIQTYFIEASM